MGVDSCKTQVTYWADWFGSLKKFFEKVNQSVFYQVYGSTESTVWYAGQARFNIIVIILFLMKLQQFSSLEPDEEWGYKYIYTYLEKSVMY
jgi:hypothetical protein